MTPAYVLSNMCKNQRQTMVTVAATTEQAQYACVQHAAISSSYGLLAVLEVTMTLVCDLSSMCNHQRRT